MPGPTLGGAKTAAVTVQLFKSVELPVQFALSIVAARSLGPDKLGEATVLLSIQALVYAIGSFGFDEILQRRVAGRSVEAAAPDITSALRAKALASVLFLSAWIIGGITGLVDKDLAAAGGWLAVGTGATLLSNTVYSVGLASYTVVILAGASLLSWMIPLAAMAGGHLDSVAEYMLALAIGATTRLLVSSFWVARAGSRPPISRGAPWLLERAREHWGVVGYAVSNQVLARHGDVFVASFAGLSTAVIGVYGLAYQIATACNQFLLLGVGAIGLSRLSEQRDDVPKLANSWRRLSVVAAGLAFGPLCLVILLAPEIQQYLFGSQYASLVGLLQALAVVQWVARVAGGGTNVMALLALGRMGFVGTSAVLGAVLNISFGMVGALVWGVYGIAAASALAGVIVGARNMAQVVAVCGGSERVDPMRLLTSPWVPRRQLALLSVGVGLSLLVANTASDGLRIGAASLLAFGWGLTCWKMVRDERS